MIIKQTQSKFKFSRSKFKLELITRMAELFQYCWYRVKPLDEGHRMYVCDRYRYLNLENLIEIT